MIFLKIILFPVTLSRSWPFLWSFGKKMKHSHHPFSFSKGDTFISGCMSVSFIWHVIGSAVITPRCTFSLRVQGCWLTSLSFRLWVAWLCVQLLKSASTFWASRQLYPPISWTGESSGWLRVWNKGILFIGNQRKLLPLLVFVAMLKPWHLKFIFKQKTVSLSYPLTLTLKNSTAPLV